MNSVYNFLGSNVPDMPFQVATAFAVGGATLTCYGGLKLKKAKGVKETCTASGYMIVGIASMALGAALGATKAIKLTACREYLAGDKGVIPPYYTKLPSLKEGQDYTDLDATGYGDEHTSGFKCHATLTDNFKDANPSFWNSYSSQAIDGLRYTRFFHENVGTFDKASQADHLAICGPKYAVRTILEAGSRIGIA